MVTEMTISGEDANLLLGAGIDVAASLKVAVKGKGKMSASSAMSAKVSRKALKSSTDTKITTKVFGGSSCRFPF
jgi:hypothetical protein